MCALCGKPIATFYYEANGQIVCSSCKQKVQAANVSGVSASSFLRAVFFGLGGAVAGAAVYYAVLALTGYEIGLIAILVGFMVGYAVRLGAGGLGGRRYQILALVLTYLAIGSTYVPLVMREFADAQPMAADSLAAETDSLTVRGPAALGIALGVRLALAAMMPIMVAVAGFPSSLISALIVGFALYQAWRMNGRVKVTFTGPFKVGTAPAPGGTAGA